MPLNRMQQLAREYAYEPDRGIENDPAPEPVQGKACELPVRLNGCRVFVATDQHGEVCAVGLMEDGGDKRRMVLSLYRAMDGAERMPLMKVV